MDRQRQSKQVNVNKEKKSNIKLKMLTNTEIKNNVSWRQ